MGPEDGSAGTNGSSTNGRSTNGRSTNGRSAKGGAAGSDNDEAEKEWGKVGVRVSVRG